MGKKQEIIDEIKKIDMLHVDEPKRKGMNTIGLNEGSLSLSASDKCMQRNEGV